MAQTPQPAAKGPLPEEWRVDRSLFPKAYGILADEHLMYPVDVSNWPIKIDASRQLFVDDYLVASMNHLTRQVHPVERHPGNPLIVPDKPWEGGAAFLPIIYRNEQTGAWRMWYAGLGGWFKPNGPSRMALYAESADGIHWTKPELGLHDYQGSKANNILILEGQLRGMFYEPWETDPSRRYKGLVLLYENQPNEGYYLYTSPDGIHWTRVREQALAWSQHRYTMPTSGIGDATTFRWDERLKKYIGDVKFVLPPKMRCRGIMESDDLIHWTRPMMTLYPDGLDDPDTQIYSHRGFIYESMWIGFAQIYHEKRDVNSAKQTPIELTASRDGRHWTRVGNRQEMIPITKHGHWDAHYNCPTMLPFLVNDELWIYYHSTPMDAQKKGQRLSIGLGTLRRDGFVSLDAGQSPGMVVTRPLTFAGKTLFVNTEVAADGYLKVELRNAVGNPIGSYRLDQCTPIVGNQLSGPVSWGNRLRIDHDPAESLRLAFEMKNAKLYSFWIE